MTFRRTILATTALVLCVATAYAGRERGRLSDRIALPSTKWGVPGVVVHGVPVTVLTGGKFSASARVNDSLYEPGATFSNLSRDKNAEFISWYGYTVTDMTSSYYQSSHYHYKFSEVGLNAAPFTGAGKTVKTIAAAVGGGASGVDYSLGIHSATASGVPGRELAGGSAVAYKSGLLRVNVDILLNAGQEYFLVAGCAAAPCDGVWYLENTNFSGSAKDYRFLAEYETYRFTGYTQTEFYSNSPSWRESLEIPATGAFVIK